MDRVAGCPSDVDQFLPGTVGGAAQKLRHPEETTRPRLPWWPPSLILISAVFYCDEDGEPVHCTGHRNGKLDFYKLPGQEILFFQNSLFFKKKNSSQEMHQFCASRFLKINTAHEQ